jgi:hypothetical protein
MGAKSTDNEIMTGICRKKHEEYIMAKCLRCGATDEWIEGRVRDEASVRVDEQVMPGRDSDDGSGWRRVEDEKPEPDVRVLAWSREMKEHGYGVYFGYRVKGKVIDECRFENTSGFYFTHWKPVPSPPEV